MLASISLHRVSSQVDGAAGTVRTPGGGCDCPSSEPVLQDWSLPRLNLLQASSSRRDDVGCREPTRTLVKNRARVGVRARTPKFVELASRVTSRQPASHQWDGRGVRAHVASRTQRRLLFAPRPHAKSANRANSAERQLVPATGPEDWRGCRDALNAWTFVARDCAAHNVANAGDPEPRAQLPFLGFADLHGLNQQDSPTTSVISQPPAPQQQ
jgi:hypothetical protein